MTSRKAQKEAENNEFMEEVSKEAKGIIDKVVGDVGKASATRQLIIGSASGWITGYLMMKVGKVAAVAVGGGIILLQVANHNGYVKINWDKVFKQADEISEKIETTASKKGPNLMDKILLEGSPHLREKRLIALCQAYDANDIKPSFEN